MNVHRRFGMGVNYFTKLRHTGGTYIGCLYRWFALSYVLSEVLRNLLFCLASVQLVKVLWTCIDILSKIDLHRYRRFLQFFRAKTLESLVFRPLREVKWTS